MTKLTPASTPSQVHPTEMSDFRTGRILGKHFPEAQVHTVHRTSAVGTSPMDSMDECMAP